MIRLISFLGVAVIVVHAFAASPPIVPDPTFTPGQWHNPPTPLGVLCRPGYTKTVRDVPESLKTKVFREYGLDPTTIDHRDYEIDHLVSLELDGTNDITNLWPESYTTEPLNAHRKDVLENALKRLVCSNKLALADAQKAISTNWVAAYNTYVKRIHEHKTFQIGHSSAATQHPG